MQERSRALAIPKYPNEVDARFSRRGTRRHWRLLKVAPDGTARYRAEENGRTYDALVTPEGWAFGTQHGHILVATARSDANA